LALNIELLGLDDFLKDPILDPQIHIASFNESANATAHNAIGQLAEGVEQRYHIRLPEKSKNLWQVTAVQDGTSNKDSGIMQMKPIHINLDEGEIRILFKGRSLNMSRFVTSWNSPAQTVGDIATKKTRLRKSEPYVKIRPNRTPHRIKGTFDATMKSGHRGVFQRYSNSKKIFEVRTITLPSMLHSVGTIETLNKAFDDVFGKEYTKNLRKRGV